MSVREVQAAERVSAFSSPARSLGDPGITPLSPSHIIAVNSAGGAAEEQAFSVVVAIDFGTTSSGYAFAFSKEPEYHIMRRWEGGDPGVSNQKTPTPCCWTPDRKFHTFGFAARDFYHDLDPSESKQWLYFEKFKMKLHSSTAGMVSPENPEQLIIALEPEGASIYCRKLRLHQMIDLSSKAAINGISPTDPAKDHGRRNRQSRIFMVENVIGELWAELEEGDRYVVVDCGGGTVDLTVHQIRLPEGHLKELYKASGGPYGSLGVDFEFEKLLCKIFGEDFIDQFKVKRPAAWVDLMIAFESRKRAAAPDRTNPLNITLPFSFIDYYKKFRGHSVEHALRKSNVDFVKWSSQGMLRMNPDAMNALFKPTVDHIIQHLSDLFQKPELSGVKFLFLVGGFAESPLLQQAVQRAFGEKCRVIIPHDVGLTILKGAVLFGLDPAVIKVRRSPMTYGVGVLNRYVEGKHPAEKLLVKDGTRWCTDIFDKFILVDQSVALGETVKRSYTPAKPSQLLIIINVYSSESEGANFISDPGVRKCGTLRLDLTGVEGSPILNRREIQTILQFGDTEIKATAIDVATTKSVKVNIDFLN
ncbi:LOW QUALITY PROTEIN: heat shock 70 kDa protein 12A [Anomaloglossus baeobatrachus]